MATIFGLDGEHIWKPLSDKELADLQKTGLEIVSFKSDGGGGTALLDSSERNVLVNGEPVFGGIRLLKHQDEICVGRQRFYFSAESIPEIVTYRAEAGQRRVRCPICRGGFDVSPTTKVVVCPGPGCSRIYHQIAGAPGQREKLCWTYNPTCRFCGHPTSLSGELAWSPEMLEKTHE